MELGSSGFPRGSAPRRYRRRTPEWRQALSTDPELRSRQHPSVLQSACSLISCDLVSQGRFVLQEANSHRAPSRTCRRKAPSAASRRQPAGPTARPGLPATSGAVVTPTNHRWAPPRVRIASDDGPAGHGHPRWVSTPIPPWTMPFAQPTGAPGTTPAPDLTSRVRPRRRTGAVRQASQRRCQHLPGRIPSRAHGHPTGRGSG